MSGSELKCPSCGFERLEADRLCLMCGFNFLIHEAAQREASKDSALEREKAAETENKGKDSSIKESVKALACPACGFERSEGDKNCLMCGINFGIHEETMKKEAEKENAKDGQPTEPPVFIDITGFDEGYSDSDRLVMEFDDKEQVIGICKRCGSKRIFGDYECRGCGIVFSKLEALESRSSDDDESELGREPFYKSAFDFSSGIFLFFKGLVKSLVLIISEILRIVFGIVKDKAPAAANSVWKVRKPFIYAFSISMVLFVAYYSVKLGINKYEAYTEEKRVLENQRLVNDKADRFHSNSLAIRDSILETAEKEGAETAISLLSEYDIPDLRYNPIMIWIKNSLDEMDLNEKLKLIPYEEHEDRFKAFERLLDIDPSNKFYAESFESYRNLLSEDLVREASSIIRNYNKDRAILEKGIALAQKAHDLVPSNENASLLFKAKSERLLFYEGNENVHIALRDDGFSGKTLSNQRKIRVWVKNTGSDPFRINPDFFALVCDDGVKYPYNDFSKNLVTELGPGSEVEGDVYFYTRSKPSVFIFDHPRTGKVTRLMP